MPEPAAAVRTVVEELAARGARGFRASHVATVAHEDIEKVRHDLVRLVGDGLLTMNFEVLCPDNGASVRTYGTREEIPFGQEISDERCESLAPFIVDEDLLWVTFTPSRQLLLDLNAQAPHSEKKRRSPKAKRRWWAKQRQTRRRSATRFRRT